jgi:branched-chain amino acid transport system permease protein
MSSDLLMSGVLIGALISFVALGFALTFSVLKFINFAHGDLMTVGAYLTYVGVRALQLNIFVSAVIAILLTGALGVLIERLAFRPLRRERLSMFVSSLGVSLVINALLTLTFGGSSRTLTTMANGLDFGYVTLAVPEIIALMAFILLVVTLTIVLRRTRFGLAARAISEDWNATALLGIPSGRVVSGTFFVSSALAGFAGVLFALMYGLTPQMGRTYGIWAFVVVVVAGFGNLPGLAASGIITGLTIVLVMSGLGSYTYVNAVLFGTMTIFLFWRPLGLFGTRLRSF